MQKRRFTPGKRGAAGQRECPALKSPENRSP
jgi:hypothetical protein